MNNFDFKSMRLEDIIGTGNALLKEGGVDVSSLSTDGKKTNLAVLLAYKEELDKRFSKRLKEFEDSIDVADFYGTYTIGNHKITFKVKEVIDAKAIGITNEGLKSAYNIADSIISVDTKTIVTLKKDKAYDAYVAQIPEVLDAIRDGKLSQPTIIKTKTSTVK